MCGILFLPSKVPFNPLVFVCIVCIMCVQSTGVSQQPSIGGVRSWFYLEVKQSITTNQVWPTQAHKARYYVLNEEVLPGCDIIVWGLRAFAMSLMTSTGRPSWWPDWHFTLDSIEDLRAILERWVMTDWSKFVSEIQIPWRMNFWLGPHRSFNSDISPFIGSGQPIVQVAHTLNYF